VPPNLLGKGGEGQHVGRCRLKVLGHAEQPSGQEVEDAVEWGVHREAPDWP
jgi:hypothetical protein